MLEGFFLIQNLNYLSIMSVFNSFVELRCSAVMSLSRGRNSVIEGCGRGGPDMVVSFGEGCRFHGFVDDMRTCSCVGAVSRCRRVQMSRASMPGSR